MIDRKGETDYVWTAEASSPAWTYLIKFWTVFQTVANQTAAIWTVAIWTVAI
jgi:hypothetical protein